MTDAEAKKFYNSKAWENKRIEILKRDHFECQDCKGCRGRTMVAGKRQEDI